MGIPAVTLHRDSAKMLRLQHESCRADAHSGLPGQIKGDRIGQAPYGAVEKSSIPAPWGAARSTSRHLKKQVVDEIVCPVNGRLDVAFEYMGNHVWSIAPLDSPALKAMHMVDMRQHFNFILLNHDRNSVDFSITIRSTDVSG